MTRDEVLALAREVGLWEMLEGYSSEYGSLDAEEDCLPNLQRFAAVIAAHEREECVKVADFMREVSAKQGQEAFAVIANGIANAIRSRT